MFLEYNTAIITLLLILFSAINMTLFTKLWTFLKRMAFIYFAGLDICDIFISNSTKYIETILFNKRLAQ